MKKTKRYTRSSNDSGGSGSSTKARTKKKKKNGGSPIIVEENLIPAISDPTVLVHVTPDLRIPLENVVDDSMLQRIHEWGKNIEMESLDISEFEGGKFHVPSAIYPEVISPITSPIVTTIEDQDTVHRPSGENL